MARFAVLLWPSANRVYAQASVELGIAELEILSAALGDRFADVGSEQIAGVSYLTFAADELDDRTAAYVANLSTTYALFDIVGDLLRPVGGTRLDRYDDDLLTVLKYPGKTNETFTKLMLNVTLLASSAAGDLLDRRLRVLDPLCGRGTTLNQALMYGYDACGIDLDAKDFEAYAGFLTTWLKRKRLKHRLRVHPVRHSGQEPARRLEVTLAPTREAYESGGVQHVDVVHADTLRCGEFFKPRSFDAIVTDAPYGVQHGSRTPGAGLSRAPLDLLAEAAPEWAELLRPGGALGISWNTHVATRAQLEGILVNAGLEPIASAPYLRMRHRVDQAIDRDLVVATRPA